MSAILKLQDDVPWYLLVFFWYVSWTLDEPFHHLVLVPYGSGKFSCTISFIISYPLSPVFSLSGIPIIWMLDLLDPIPGLLVSAAVFQCLSFLFFFLKCFLDSISRFCH